MTATEIALPDELAEMAETAYETATAAWPITILIAGPLIVCNGVALECSGRCGACGATVWSTSGKCTALLPCPNQPNAYVVGP